MEYGHPLTHHLYMSRQNLDPMRELVGPNNKSLDGRPLSPKCLYPHSHTGGLPNGTFFCHTTSYSRLTAGLLLNNCSILYALMNVSWSRVSMNRDQSQLWQASSLKAWICSPIMDGIDHYGRPLVGGKKGPL